MLRARMSSFAPRPKIVRTSPKSEHNLENENQPALPAPVSTKHKSSTARQTFFADGRWRRVFKAFKHGTGYTNKQPEWTNSLLDVSDDGRGTTTSVDGGQQGDSGLEEDDVTWLSAKDNEDTLALVLVERDLSANSQASHNMTASQDNFTALAPPTNTLHPHHPLPNDRKYRLKGYEASVHEGRLTPWFWLRYRAFPWVQHAFMRFFYPQFDDRKVEAAYSGRVYESQKFLSFVCSTYLVISWAIALTLLPKHPETSDKVFYWAIASALTVPLPIMIFYDLPKRVPIFYQCFLLVSIWSWSAYLITFMQLCRYYGGGLPHFSCAGRDMLNLFYYMVALPVIALFGMGQQRLYATIAPIIMIITPSALFIPRKSAWARFALEHIFLQALLLYIHWRREILERNVYFFNKKVKDALLALHHTRVHQSRVEAARARSTSYIFHEVRQPLNAAFLAYQNLAASTIIKPEFKFEWDTLRIKLTSMSKLLNDVLDQKRMDAGKFEIVSRPYAFHSVIRQVHFSARMAAELKKQEVTVDLDPNIDMAARIATYHAQQKSDEEIYRKIRASPGEDGIVNGDETRLTQVLNNLITNATKFTPENGKIRIVTRLVSPVVSLATPRSSTSSLRAPGRPHSSPLLTPPEVRPQMAMGGGLGTGKWDEDPERLVIRIEVVDNGCGISPSDVKDRHLFSPYAQAGVGRFQGGSGSGLGLSLVRRIVKLMGGRMGVESTAGSGTTFWVELPFKVTSVDSSSILPPLLSSPKSSYTSSGTTNVPSAQGSTGTTQAVSAQGSTGTNAASLPLPLSPTTEPDASEPPQSNVHLLPTPKISDASAKPGAPSDFNKTDPPVKVGAGISALIVDDDPTSRGLLARLLKRLGCTVAEAENGKVALQKLGMNDAADASSSPEVFKEQRINFTSPAADILEDPLARHTVYPFDVIFLDNQMPVMTGIEVASALRLADRRDFVVGLTGEAHVSDQERFLGAGVDEVLSKPALESQLREVLQKARARQPKDQSPRHLTREHQPP